MRREKYIGKEGALRNGSRHRYQKEISTKREEEEERERRVNSVTTCTNLAFSGELVEGDIPLYFIRLTFSSLS